MNLSPSQIAQITKTTGAAPLQGPDGNWYLPNGAKIQHAGLSSDLFVNSGGSSGNNLFLTGDNAGQVQKATGIGTALKDAGIAGAATLGAGLALGGFGAAGAGASAGGGASAAPAVAVGGQDAGDAAAAADGLVDGGGVAANVPVASSVVGGSVAPSAMSFLKPALISSIFQGAGGLIGAFSAKSAGNQMKAAGQAAAASFSPYQQAGISGLNRALQLNGLPAVSMPAPATTGGAPTPYATAPAPAPGNMTMVPAGPVPAYLQPGPLSSLYTQPTQSSFTSLGGR